MIGDKIRFVVEAFRSRIRNGDLPFEVFDAGCEQLLDAARLADRMEGAPVPTSLRETGSSDPGAPIVDLASWRRRLPARPARRPVDRLDGGG